MFKTNEKMKARFAIFPLIAAAALSCGKERVESGNRPDLADIAFATPSSRGAQVNTAAKLAEAGGFNVWAYSHAGNWVSNPAKTALLAETAVTSANGASWVYSPAKDWPADGNNVSFFAYGPRASATVTGNTPQGVPTISFTVAADPLQQKDLQIAAPVYDQFGMDHPDGKPVSLFFNHALSLVHFTARIDGEMTQTVKVRKIELRNLYYQGSTTLEIPVAWNLVTSATHNYALSIGSGLNDLALTTSTQGITAPNGSLFLMPQTLRAEVELAVTLDVDGGTVSYAGPIPAPEAWIPGKAYEYQIIIDHDAIKVIVIDSDITLAPMNRSATTQSVILSDDTPTDMTNIYGTISQFDTLNSNGMVAGCNYFGLYGTYDVKHDITIDFNDAALGSFTNTQYLIFDFKKTVGVWGHSGEDYTTNYTVKVTNYAANWELVPSYQTPIDASTGATTQTPSDEIRNKGTIMLKRK